MHYNVSVLDDDSSFQSVFGRKLAFMTKRAIVRGSYQNASEAHDSVFASYACVAFNEETKEKWSDDMFDCADLEDVIPDSTTKHAPYLGIVKVILSGNDREDAANTADEMTRFLLTTDATDRFIDVAERCMNDQDCGPFSDLNLQDFHSLVHCVYIVHE